jgi:hypothetical protein
MANLQKSWVDKPKVIKIEGKMTARWDSGTLAIPSPVEIDALMKKAG